MTSVGHPPQEDENTRLKVAYTVHMADMTMDQKDGPNAVTWAKVTCKQNAL